MAAEPIVDQIGPYKILRRINSESTSQIYEAIHQQIQRRAAIKILNKDLAEDAAAIKRFLNEARIVNLINHSSIASIYEHGQLENGAPYIIMEYLQGETLRSRLRRLGKSMEPIKAMRIARYVASALAAAHTKQVVHRDLKPENIMLVADADTAEGERVKILNFGIAKLTQVAGTNNSLLTQSGVSMGTPTYMSPEQCKNARDVTDRSDVYALGILLYEMLSGAPPFSDAEGPVRVMMAHMNQDPAPLQNRAPDASVELCLLVHRMLAKAPETRPTAMEAANFLAGLSGSKVSAMMPSVAAPAVEPQVQTSPTRLLPPPPKDESDSSPLLELWRNPTGRLVVGGAGLAILLGIIGIIAAVGVLGHGGPPPPPQVTWSVLSEPADAEVRDAAGQVLGQTPWKKTQQKGEGLVTLTIRKRGYTEDTIVLDRARDLEQKVTLTALPPEPAETPPEPTTPEEKAKDNHKPKRGKHKSGKGRR